MTFSSPACRNLKNKLVSHKEQWQVADWYIISTEVAPTNQTWRFWQFYWESESVRNLKGNTTKFKIYSLHENTLKSINSKCLVKFSNSVQTSLYRRLLWPAAVCSVSVSWQAFNHQHQSFVIKLPSLHLYKLMSGLFPSSGFLFVYPRLQTDISNGYSSKQAKRVKSLREKQRQLCSLAGDQNEKPVQVFHGLFPSVILEQFSL